jgi:hypothetical protein
MNDEVKRLKNENGNTFWKPRADPSLQFGTASLRLRDRNVLVEDALDRNQNRNSGGHYNLGPRYGHGFTVPLGCQNLDKSPS